VLHKYPHDYKVVFVGDASMSPYEVMVPGGSVEHVNEESGIGLARAHHAHLSARGLAQSGSAAALGLFGIHHPDPPVFSERMFPITIEGLEGAMKELVR